MIPLIQGCIKIIGKFDLEQVRKIDSGDPEDKITDRDFSKFNIYTLSETVLYYQNGLKSIHVLEAIVNF